MGMCKLNHWSQRGLYIYTLGITLLWKKYTSFPLDFQLSQVSCFGQCDVSRHGANRSLKCACTTRPACLYLGQDHERACPRQQLVQEDERHVEQTWNPPTAWTWAQPSQAHPANPQPIYTCMRGTAVLSHWVGVDSIQHYWSKSWLREQSDKRNMRKDFINYTDTNSSDNNPFPHQFPKNVFKNSIWVAAFFFVFLGFFTSGRRYCLPIREEDNP